MELEAIYDKYCLSVRKRVDFFGNVLSRIRDELETRDLSAISTETLFAMHARFDREAQRALPELTFRNEDEIRVAKSRRLLFISDTSIDAALDNFFSPSKKS